MARPRHEQIGFYIETGAGRAMHRMWEAAHGGTAPRSVRTVYNWRELRKLVLPSDFADPRSYFNFSSGQMTHVDSVRAALDVLAASEHPGRPPKKSGAALSVSCPSPSFPFGRTVVSK